MSISRTSRDEDRRRNSTKDEARRIAVNIAKLTELSRALMDGPQYDGVGVSSAFRRAQPCIRFLSS